MIHVYTFIVRPTHTKVYLSTNDTRRLSTYIYCRDIITHESIMYYSCTRNKTKEHVLTRISTINIFVFNTTASYMPVLHKRPALVTSMAVYTSVVVGRWWCTGGGKWQINMIACSCISSLRSEVNQLMSIIARNQSY